MFKFLIGVVVEIVTKLFTIAWLIALIKKLNLKCLKRCVSSKNWMEIKMKILPIALLSIIPFGLVACASENNQTTKEQQTNISFPSAPLIDIYNDKLLVESAKASVVNTSKSTDTENKPKMIYQFDKMFSQIEISEHQILVAWGHSNESDSMKKFSLDSQQNARNILTAIFGQAGESLVHLESTPLGEQTLSGLKVTNVSCVSGFCSLKIYR